MSDTEVNALLNQFREDSRHLRAELEKLLTENEQLRVERDRVIREARESVEMQQRMPSENFSEQLANTEQNLIQERQHAVKAMATSNQLQKQNAELRRVIAQAQQAFATQKGEFQRQLDILNKQTQQHQLTSDTKAGEISRLEALVQRLQADVSNKDEIIRQTRAERDEINSNTRKTEMSLDQKNLELHSGMEQMAALRNQIALLKEKATASERRMLELNGELSRQSQIRDEMAMKMREMEQVAAATVQREINLGMKERHVEQLAEDYRLEIHEMKAKLTNSSFQAKHWREANEALIAEVGERVRKSVAEAKEEANRELEEAHTQLDIAVKNEAKIKETLDRAIREKRTAESTLEELLSFRKDGDDHYQQIVELNKKLSSERKSRDNLSEQVRMLQQRVEDLKAEIIERDSWRESEVKQAQNGEETATAEMLRMRKTLTDITNENTQLASLNIKDQGTREKTEAALRIKVNELEEKLVEADIKSRAIKSQEQNSTVIRELQEEISTARAGLNRWKSEAIQIAQEADQKLRQNRQEKQGLNLKMKDIREEMQEIMNQNADFARQLEESERDRAQLTARIGTLQQKLKPFLVNGN
ncbi:Oidioi.mRNA.OKI2018_I69.PAR.g11376.t1.cds [Oikopleura dioica]|uniref:Oidioi.mRNA.OKI2018_I69.PAR.g11376.t1.cds n=1 Tax=Oikopleura dioica TaxID=34765 RepID=A0ABN7RYF4_OIKDI|nr:Oidioi.mRNA.OKI2018_I69.PAR.g11376.t1.cds [Oikopleura dioica]